MSWELPTPRNDDSLTAPRPKMRPTARRGRWKIWAVVLLASAVLVACGWGAFTLWRWREIAGSAAACREAMNRKDWKQLDTVAARWTELEPHRADPWIYRAEAAQNLGNLQLTADLLEHVPDHDAKSVPALLERAELLFGPLNKPLDAVATWERVLRLNPRACDAHRRLMFFYALSRQRKELFQGIDRAFEQRCDAPDTYLYLIGADYLIFTNGYSLNTQWLGGQPEHEQFLVARAIFVLGSGRLDEADAVKGTSPDEISSTDRRKRHERVLDTLRTRFPQNLELLNYFLDKHLTNGDADQVAELLASAPESALTDSRFWRYKGWLHATREELHLAETAYRRALSLHRYDYHSYHELAGVLRRLGQGDQAKLLEEIATEGTALRRIILQLPDTSRVSPQLLERIGNYAGACGDEDVANRIFDRLEGGPGPR